MGQPGHRLLTSLITEEPHWTRILNLMWRVFLQLSVALFEEFIEGLKWHEGFSETVLAVELRCTANNRDLLKCYW